MTAKIDKRSGFTLMELLVVLGILALLAMLAVPLMSGLFDRGRSATQAYSLTDTSRMLENFYALNHKYPDGWDSLMDTTGTQYTKLSPNLRTPHTFFTTATLSDDQVTSLNSAGIGHLFLHDATSTDYSNSGTDRRHMGTGTGHDGTANVNTVVVIDKTAGNDGLNLLVNDFGLNPNRAATDTTLPRISANIYVVLGLGPKSTAVQGIVQSVPLLEHPSSSTSYSRALVIFEVPTAGTARAKLVGVMGPDGRALRQAIADYNNPNGPQPH